jgi:hypothetical protein
MNASSITSVDGMRFVLGLLADTVGARGDDDSSKTAGATTRTNTGAEIRATSSCTSPAREARLASATETAGDPISTLRFAWRCSSEVVGTAVATVAVEEIEYEAWRWRAAAGARGVHRLRKWRVRKDTSYMRTEKVRISDVAL